MARKIINADCLENLSNKHVVLQVIFTEQSYKKITVTVVLIHGRVQGCYMVDDHGKLADIAENPELEDFIRSVHGENIRNFITQVINSPMQQGEGRDIIRADVAESTEPTVCTSAKQVFVTSSTARFEVIGT